MFCFALRTTDLKASIYQLRKTAKKNTNKK